MKLVRVNAWRGIAVVALLTGAVPAHAQTPTDMPTANSNPAEATVVAVRIVKENGEVIAEGPSGIAVKAGKPLDPVKVADSLRALYRTGDYADLKAVAAPVAGGVRLDFVAHENLFFNQIRF